MELLLIIGICLGSGLFCALLEVGGDTLIEKIGPCQHGENGTEIKKDCYVCKAKANAILQQYIDEKMAPIRKRKSNAKKQYLKEFKRVRNHYLSKSNNLMKISPKEFELTIQRLFNKLGYEARTTPYVNDEGKDIIAKKDGRTTFIECKQYCTDNKVSRPFLQKLFGAMAEHKVDDGMLITTSDFSKPAIEYAERVGIKLINHFDLCQLFKKAYGGKDIEKIILLCPDCNKKINFKFDGVLSTKKCDCGCSITNDLTLNGIEEKLTKTKNACIKCGSEMKLRDGKHGKFFGCKTFPSCDFTSDYNGYKVFDQKFL